VQGVHVPLSQTSFGAHVCPVARVMTLAVHADTPDAHDVVPVWQRLPPGWQARPPWQVVHIPLSQTSLVPHVAPLPRVMTFWVHAGRPDAHEIVPVWQVFPPGLHAIPAEQATQVPALQTMSVPQGVPSETFWGCVHVDTPVAHDVVPSWQRLPPGLHPEPAVHMTHAPVPLQTSLVPQGVPALALRPVSVHVALPAAQTVVPVWHAFAAGVHEAPLEHAAQLPLSQ
jgi:hypothetical protein